MKSQKFIIAISLLSASYGMAQTDTENYVKSTTYKEGHNEAALSSVPDTEKVEEVTYYDGLGRPKLNVKKRAGGNGQDIVTPITYDAYGRQDKQYLPYASPNENATDATLSYRDPETVIGQLNTYYGDAYPDDIDTGAPNPYSQTIFESSPLNRVLEQGAPGESWKAIEGDDSDHTIKYAYGTNTAFEVNNYSVGFIGGNTERTTLNYDGKYPQRQLYKTVTKDENWQPGQQYTKDHTVEEFTNKQGQVVLKRTYNENLPHDTHYVYDDYGNLTYVLSPEASRAIAGLYSGPVLEGTLTRSWVNLAEVDSKFAQAYERKLQDYQDEEILNADVENEYGGQGGFTLDATNGDGGAKLSLNISFSATTALALKRGYLLSLNDYGQFKDAELGRVSGDGYAYIFSISKNQILIEGQGKLSQLNATLTNTGKLSYSHNYPWTDYLEVDPGVAKDYNNQLAGYKNEEILSANIPNPYGAQGGMNISVDDSDNIAITLNHSSSQALAFSKQSIIPLKVSRRLEDRELDVLQVNGASYNFSVQDNNLVIQAMGVLPTLSFNGTIFGPVTPWYPGKVMNRSIVPGLGYIYHYDHRNRLIEKKISGKGWEYIVYDKLDRPVLTQDANLRLDDQWLFTKYDAHGRVVYTGLYQFNPTQTNAVEKRLELQALVDNQTGNTAVHSIYSEQRLDSPVTVAGTTVYYSNQVFPTQVEELHSVNYYDSYDDLGIVGDAFPSQSFLPQQVAAQFDYGHTQGNPTVSRVRVLGTNNWINSVSFYDKKSRPIYSYTHNEYLDSRDYSYSQLNFIGEVEESGNLHIKGSENIQVIDEFTYDHMGRLLTQVQTINDLSPELIANNSYDELGQLKNKKVGGTVAAVPGSSNGLQRVDYTYNIRGWLTAINDPQVQTGNDLFRFGIYYDQAMGSESSPLYNGNISSVKWRSGNDPQKTRIYNYHYDALNRLTGAAFKRFGYDVDRNGNPLPEPAGGYPDNYDVEGIGYDRNGNIMELTRYGMSGTVLGPSGPYQAYDIIDQLAYDYKSYGNQLEKVSDTGTDQGFKDGTNTGNDYAYDLNGNLIADANKGITGIEYNHLNLPVKVTVTGENAGVIDYIYDATGKKLKNIVNDQANITEIQYSGSYIYENNILKQIVQPEGYIEPDGNGNFDYIYQYKDIWHNIRLSYKEGINGLEIVEENNYYPFGLQHKGYNNVLNGIENNYQTYQGQELTKGLGLNVHEWKYRISDPAIGRFWQVDPLAEDYYYNSVYAFQENKMGMGIELEGLEASTDKGRNRRVLLNTARNLINNPNKKSTGKPVLRLGVGTTKKSIKTASGEANAVEMYAEFQATSEGPKLESGIGVGNFKEKTSGEEFNMLKANVNYDINSDTADYDVDIIGMENEQGTETTENENNNTEDDVEATGSYLGAYLSINFSEVGRMLNDIGILIDSYIQAQAEEYTGGHSGTFNLDLE